MKLSKQSFNNTFEWARISGVSFVFVGIETEGIKEN